jgi:diguanylate cyclase (GGDEF)-like protein/PAS domain S-box-containing protein
VEGQQETPRPGGRPSRLWRVGAGAAAAVLAVSVVAGFLIAATQTARRDALADRFDGREANASQFIEAYVAQVMAQEQHLAVQEFSGDVPAARFDAIVGYSQFSAAVLLDGEGRLLRVMPTKPALIGTQVGARYAHLRSALAGTPAVSDVVPSASQRRPVIGFAVPFDTPAGRRVFSGAYAIATTPLQPFVTSALSNYRTADVYLLDSAGTVISADQPDLVGRPLRQVAAPLAHRIAQQRAGYLGHGEQRRHYVSNTIAGTPWTLVFTLDSDELFQAYTPFQQGAPWAALAGFIVLGLGIVALLVRAVDRGEQARDEHASQRAILDTAADAYVGMDHLGLVSDWNTAASRLLGWTRAEALGRPVAALMIPRRDRENHNAGLNNFLATGQERLPRHAVRVAAQHRDGREIPVELTVSRSQWRGTWRFHAFVRDIAERLEHEQQLQALALTDFLTGLANRRAFLERLEQTHARARRRGVPVVVLYADIDHFKRINDTYGHAAGDAILQEVADRLRATFRTEDTIGRLGGDEFAVVCEDFDGEPDELTERLTVFLAVPYTYRGDSIRTKVSIGYATSGSDDSPQRLLERADATMYQVKAAHR